MKKNIAIKELFFQNIQHKKTLVMSMEGLTLLFWHDFLVGDKDVK